jgi:hypothetical protein
VQVPTPGLSGAEGEEQGKGVTARGRLEEAPSKRAGRRTGTGYEVWYTRDEWARDHEVLHPRVGVLYKSGAYARIVLCLTLGDLQAVRARAHAHGELSEGRPEPIGMQKSAEGILGTEARAEGPNGWQEGLPDVGPRPRTWTAA